VYIIHVATVAMVRALHRFIEQVHRLPRPTGFVLSLNLLRRQLDEGQSALIGARSLPLFQDEARA
jgi:hypothetical protein